MVQYVNYLFEVEGEFPVFVQVVMSDHSEDEAWAVAKWVYSDYEEDEIELDGAYDDYDVEALGWDTFTPDDVDDIF